MPDRYEDVYEVIWAQGSEGRAEDIGEQMVLLALRVAVNPGKTWVYGFTPIQARQVAMELRIFADKVEGLEDAG